MIGHKGTHSAREARKVLFDHEPQDEGVHPSGEGVQHVAKDHEGNYRGHYDPVSKKGHLLAHQYSEETDAQFWEERGVQFVEEPDHVLRSSHHQKLKAAGYKYVASGVGDWDHYYKHKNGSEAKISFNHSNDIDGTLSKRRKDSSQHSEEQDPPTDWEALVAQGPVGTQHW